MGCCGSKQEVQNTTNIPFLDYISRGEFPDMEDTPKERYIGVGILRIHNYTCPLAIDQLDNIREKFWETRDKTDKTWKILKSCINVDSTEAEKILKDNNIVCLENSIQDTYNKKQPSHIYHIPNFVIADPIFEKEYKYYEEIYDLVEDVNLNLKLNHVSKGIIYPVKLRTKDTGFDVIHKFLKLSKIDNRFFSIRIVFNGQEIEDTHCLYYHKIKDGDTLQVITSPRGDTVQTYSKIVSRKSVKRLDILEKIKLLESAEKNKERESSVYEESIKSTSNQEKNSNNEGETNNENKYKKYIKKKNKGNIPVIKENEEKSSENKESASGGS